MRWLCKIVFFFLVKVEYVIHVHYKMSIWFTENYRELFFFLVCVSSEIVRWKNNGTIIYSDSSQQFAKCARLQWKSTVCCRLYFSKCIQFITPMRTMLQFERGMLEMQQAETFNRITFEWLQSLIALISIRMWKCDLRILNRTVHKNLLAISTINTLSS